MPRSKRHLKPWPKPSRVFLAFAAYLLRSYRSPSGRTAAATASSAWREEGNAFRGSGRLFGIGGREDDVLAGLRPRLRRTAGPSGTFSPSPDCRLVIARALSFLEAKTPAALAVARRSGKSSINKMTSVVEPEEPSPSRFDHEQIAAWSTLVLATIAVGFVLYAARVLFLPIVAAFVIGAMLSPVATQLEKYHVPRLLSALLIVAVTAGLIALVIALISSPLAEWTSRLPELGSRLRDKLQVFDGWLAWWRDVQSTLGIDPKSVASLLPLTNLDWLPTTIAFLSPTVTEFPFFLVVLLLFIASWPDLRRGLVMTFTGRDSRLLTLKILNDIEASLADYLRTVTLINLCLGVAVALICVLTGTPGPIGLGVLAATFNFIPIIGPIAMVAVLLAVGIVAAPTFGVGLLAASGFMIVVAIEGQFITPHIIGRRLSLNGLAVLLSLAFWTWLWGPMGAFLSSPLLIVGLTLKERLLPDEAS
jgi:predicted PurR-regulated permease PerM